MKKGFVFVLLLCCLCSFIVVFASGESILAFEEKEYSVLIGKTLKLKPVAQNIKGKLKYTWESSDESIATIKNGNIKGVAEGQVTITCTTMDSQKQEYTTECTVNVMIPVSKIEAKEPSVTYPSYTSFTPELIISPENAAIKEIEWKSSDERIVKANPNGSFTTQFKAGTATMTGKAKDGSGKSVKIKVTVPQCYVTDDNITITTPEGVQLGYSYTSGSGIFMYNTKIKGNVFTTKSLDKSDGLNMLQLIPQKAGSGSISFICNGKTLKTVKVKVEHSAVYDDVSYPPVKVSKMISNQDESVGIKTQVKIEVAERYDRKYDENTVLRDDWDEAKNRFIIYGRVEEKKENYYIAIEADNAVSFMLGKTCTVFGEVSGFVEYKTETGLVYTCPCFVNFHVE
ncbi:MAG: Ig-like domain-containing protein [Clostridia bacterium]|nr:Ig-like domain-containing protein [Clostridia bacterium]